MPRLQLHHQHWLQFKIFGKSSSRAFLFSPYSTQQSDNIGGWRRELELKGL